MPDPTSRRDFLKQTGLLTAGLAGGATALSSVSVRSQPASSSGSTAKPWYRTAARWGQTNITEIDPQHYDIAWWRSYWKRTSVKGVIVNAGGIVAYYPTKVPYHHAAKQLDGRDLFGELSRVAHEDGLAVFARMDSSKAYEDCYQAHPDWFATDSAGRPHQSGEFYVACVNSPYYEEHIPAILREIIERYHPEGFTDNSWSGLGRNSPCFCQYCQNKFRARTGQELPREKNWDTPLYREWIKWNYERRLELWDLNNRVTRAAGGPDCLWVGMNSGSISGQSQSFRDYREICRRAEIIMLDHQARNDTAGFQNNAEIGKLVHGLLGWDKLIPESMAMYQAGRPTFRFTSKPEPEAHLWMLEGIAGGLQPWWHHVGAHQEDRRMYHTAEPIFRWHQANQQYLLNRQPLATVGVLWSQLNTDVYGRDDAELLVELPWRGMTQALVRARIPYLPVHADDLDRDASQFSLLVLPNLAAMSDSQVASVKRFVERGGNLLATGQTTLFTESGETRPDFALSDLFGAHMTEPHRALHETTRRRQAADTAHTYLRIESRHAVLRGFEETDILPFGGMLEPLNVATGAEVITTFVAPFPAYPPESSWMREPKTNIPGLILNTTASGNRIVFLPADLDRRFGRDNLPDHGNLLESLLRWAAKDNVPLSVQGPGLIDCQLYQQPARIILHLMNLTNTATWRQPVEELIRVGPFHVQVKLPPDVQTGKLRSLISGKRISAIRSKGWVSFKIESILDHEVLVLG